MKHPTQEELIELFYQEGPESTRSATQAHLKECPECRELHAKWQRTANRMNDWKLAPSRRARPTAQWAAAAAIALLAVGAGVRLWTLETEVKHLRTELRQAAGPEAVRGMITEMARQYDEKRSQDQRAYLAALGKVQASNVETLAGFRKELETVALFTEAGLRRAQNDIANITYQPTGNVENQ